MVRAKFKAGQFYMQNYAEVKWNDNKLIDENLPSESTGSKTSFSASIVGRVR